MDVMVFANYTSTHILVLTCLPFCLIRNSATRLTEIYREKGITYKIPINHCRCLISEKFMERKRFNCVVNVEHFLVAVTVSETVYRIMFV